MRRFSVVVPCINPDLDRLRRAVRSVRRQSDAEIIIVDDSSDDIDGIMRVGYESNCSVQRSDEGDSVVQQVNHGIRTAKGEYVCVLRPDDYHVGGFFPLIDLTIRTQGFPPFIATRWMEASEDGIIVQCDTPAWSPLPIASGNPFRSSAFLIRRDHYEIDGLWNESLPFDEASEEAWRRATAGGSYRLLDWPLAVIMKASGTP